MGHPKSESAMFLHDSQNKCQGSKVCSSALKGYVCQKFLTDLM